MKLILRSIGNFWRWVAGDSAEDLERCTSKARIRSAACGMLLPIAAGVAGAGMAYTAWLLTSSYAWAGVLGCGWAATILLLDRGIMATFVPGRGNLFRLIPRLLLTVVGSLIFGHAAVFWFFGPALDRYLAAGARAEAETATANINKELEIARQRYQTDIATWQKRIDDLAEQAAENGNEQHRKQQELQNWRAKLDDEKEGKRASGKAGRKAEYNATKADFIDPVTAELAQLTADGQAIAGEEQRAERGLSASIQELHDGPEITSLEQRLEAEHDKIAGQNLRDFYSRLKALHALVATDPWNLAEYIVFCLFFICLELSALAVKFSAGEDDYTFHLEREQFRAREDFENFCQIYPAISADRIEIDLELDTSKYRLSRQLDLAMEKVRMVRVLAESISSEKEAYFRVVDKIVNGERNAAARENENAILRGLSASMANGFFASAHHAIHVFTRLTIGKEAESPNTSGMNAS